MDKAILLHKAFRCMRPKTKEQQANDTLWHSHCRTVGSSLVVTGFSIGMHTHLCMFDCVCVPSLGPAGFHFAPRRLPWEISPSSLSSLS